MYISVKLYRHKMARNFTAAAMFAASFVFFSCAALPQRTGEEFIILENPPVADSGVVFSEITNIVWELREIQVNYGKTELDRQAMAANDLGDSFTLQFTEEGVNGKAAPNRYFSTYELQHKHDFRLRPIVGTLMAANINIGGLMENEYYWYLQRANRWELVNGNLELYASGQDEDITLRFRRQGAY
ncbi:MAG: META domain-containing protein [Spirochaetaceae bacterium]|jgi:hypothetical protein|nr:META domain-containing protein [Spirochaetaceae bacterium]